MGFFCRVFDNGQTLRARCGKHYVYRCADADKVKIYSCSRKPVFGVAANHFIGIVNIRAEKTETFYMLVYRTSVESTAAGKPHGGLAETSQQRSYEIIRRPHLANAVRSRGNIAVYIRTVYNDRCSVFIFNRRTEIAQNSDKGSDIADVGDVFDSAFSVHKHGGRDNGDCGILCTADRHFTVKALSAADRVSYQKITPAFGFSDTPKRSVSAENFLYGTIYRVL